jgi:hypothetical protein
MRTVCKGLLSNVLHYGKELLWLSTNFPKCAQKDLHWFDCKIGAETIKPIPYLATFGHWLSSQVQC